MHGWRSLLGICGLAVVLLMFPSAAAMAKTHSCGRVGAVRLYAHDVGCRTAVRVYRADTRPGGRPPHGWLCSASLRACFLGSFGSSRSIKWTRPGASSARRQHSPAIKTLGEFAHRSHGARIQFVIHYLTTHPDACYGGRPTPRRVAKNISEPLAALKPGRDAGDGTYISASTPIGRAFRHAEANIGC